MGVEIDAVNEMEFIVLGRRGSQPRAVWVAPYIPVGPAGYTAEVPLNTV
jgi:hypothetical protein